MKNKKFTIIELLVVIAIIAILISLLLPMVNNIRNRAIKTKAKAEMHSIITAVKSYEMTYGILPIPAGVPEDEPAFAFYQENGTRLYGSVYANLIAYLTNVATTGTSTADANGNYNGRGIQFLDIPNDVNYATVGFQDPWGKDFSVLLDTDYDGKITDSNSPINGEILYGTVFVYTYVGDAAQEFSKRDYVYSWK